jgi:hypothetical protein
LSKAGLFSFAFPFLTPRSGHPTATISKPALVASGVQSTSATAGGGGRGGVQADGPFPPSGHPTATISTTAAVAGLPRRQDSGPCLTRVLRSSRRTAIPSDPSLGALPQACIAGPIQQLRAYIDHHRHACTRSSP